MAIGGTHPNYDAAAPPRSWARDVLACKNAVKSAGDAPAQEATTLYKVVLLKAFPTRFKRVFPRASIGKTLGRAGG